MSIEIMKAMANYIDVLGGDSKKYRQAIAEAEKQEPVAWMDKTGITHKHKHFEDMTPLYTHPQPNVTTSDMKQEPVAKTAKQRHEENT